jgi:hypothetical protein
MLLYRLCNQVGGAIAKATEISFENSPLKHGLRGNGAPRTPPVDFQVNSLPNR